MLPQMVVEEEEGERCCHKWSSAACVDDKEKILGN